MKKLVVAFAILMMIAGATVSVLKWLQIGPFADPNAAAKTVERDRDEPTLFVDMEPLLINVIQGDRVVVTIQLELKLETRGDKNIIKIKRLLPRFKDAFLKEMHSFMPRLLKKKERIDITDIKHRLKMVSRRVGGKELVDDVLVQSAIDTPSR